MNNVTLDNSLITDLESDNLFSEMSNGFVDIFSKYILDIKEDHILSNTLQFSLVDKSKSIVDYIINAYNKIVRAALYELDITIDSSKILKRLLSNNNFEKEYSLINSDYKFDKYIKKTIGFIKPVSYNFDLFNDKLFHYVPIIDTISTFMKKINILETLKIFLLIKMFILMYMTDQNGG